MEKPSPLQSNTVPVEDQEMVSVGDFMATQPVPSSEQEIISVDDFMGITPPVQKDLTGTQGPSASAVSMAGPAGLATSGFGKAIGWQILKTLAESGMETAKLGKTAVDIAKTDTFKSIPTPFAKEANILAKKVSAPYDAFIKRSQWGIDEADKLTKRSNKYEQFAVDMAGSLTALGVSLPTDIYFGGLVAKPLLNRKVLKLVQKLVPQQVVEGALRSTHKFASGMAVKGVWEGTAKALEEGDDAPHAIMKGLAEGGEKFVTGNLYGEAGKLGFVKGLAAMNLVGIGSTYYQTWTKERRAPSVEELKKSVAESTAFHLLFQVFPMLSKTGKDAKEQKVLDAYAKRAQKIADEKDIEGAEKFAMDLKYDENVPEPVKQAVDEVHSITREAIGVDPAPTYERDYLDILQKAVDQGKMLEVLRRRPGMEEEVADLENQIREKLAKAEELRKKHVESGRLKSSWEVAQEKFQIEKDKEALVEKETEMPKAPKVEKKAPGVKPEEKPVPSVELKQSEKYPGLQEITSEGKKVGHIQYSVEGDTAFIEDVVSDVPKKRYGMSAIQQVIDQPGVKKISGQAGTEKAKSFWKDKYGAKFDERDEFTVDVTGMKSQEGGNKKISGLSERLRQEAVEKGIIEDMTNQAEFEGINHADQARKAIDLDKNDPELAEAVALGKAQPPAESGLKSISVYNAVKNRAIATKNVPLILKLGGSKVAKMISEAAQSLGLVEKNPLDPVEIVQKMSRAKAKAHKDTGKAKRELKALDKELKKNAPKKEDWNSFLDGLEC